MTAANDSTASSVEDALAFFPLPTVGSLVDGRYRVKRLIGSGGMGAVFEAEQISVGRRCAIKFLRADVARRAQSEVRFEREALLLGMLEHEHITAVLDYGTYRDKSPFLVMEYLEGNTLQQVLQERSKLPFELALDVLQQVARGMAYVHARGIVHRDLKPSNLMLVSHSDGRVWVKILDFGIARADQGMSTRVTPTGAELGTAHYMSPEQARGAKSVGPSSDIYALGVIAYEMLAGRRIHLGDSYNAVMFQLLTQAHVPLRDVVPECPEAMSEVVECCLRKAPKHRYAEGSDLVKAIEALHGSPSGDPPRSGLQARRRRPPFLHNMGWAITGALLGAALCALLLLRFVRESGLHAAMPALGPEPTLEAARAVGPPLAETAVPVAAGKGESVPRCEPTSAAITQGSEKQTEVTTTSARQPHLEVSAARTTHSSIKNGRRQAAAPFAAPEPPATTNEEETAAEKLPEPAQSRDFPFVTLNPYGSQ